MCSCLSPGRVCAPQEGVLQMPCESTQRKTGVMPREEKGIVEQEKATDPVSHHCPPFASGQLLSLM